MWPINRNTASRSVLDYRPISARPSFFHQLMCYFAVYLQRLNSASLQSNLPPIIGVLSNICPTVRRLDANYTHLGAQLLFWIVWSSAAHLRCFHRRITVPGRHLQRLADSSQNYRVLLKFSLKTRRHIALPNIKHCSADVLPQVFFFHWLLTALCLLHDDALPKSTSLPMTSFFVPP